MGGFGCLEDGDISIYSMGFICGINCTSKWVLDENALVRWWMDVNCLDEWMSTLLGSLRLLMT